MSNQSQMIDDDELIEELRRYGEKNLPLLATGGAIPSASRRKSAGLVYLTDQNRDIYLKKLNHYRAREKIETNPSRQYLKQQLQLEDGDKSRDSKRRSSNVYGLRNEFDEDEDDQEVVEIVDDVNKTEYVQVNNAHTSPLSMSTYNTNEPEEVCLQNNRISAAKLPVTSTLAKPTHPALRTPSAESLSK